MTTNSSELLRELESQLETEISAARQRMAELITVQGEAMETDLGALDQAWKARHEELLVLGEKTMKSSAARLRMPVDELVTDLESRAGTMVEELSSTTTRVGTQTEKALGRLDNGIDAATSMLDTRVHEAAMDLEVQIASATKHSVEGSLALLHETTKVVNAFRMRAWRQHVTAALLFVGGIAIGATIVRVLFI